MIPQLARDLAVAGQETRGSPREVFLPARAVWERFGVTSMSLHRWVNNQALGFPAPIYIGRFRYWKLSDIQAWEATRPRTGSRKAVALSAA
jgi:predicted DNA-binding transcriptional regulator AlpA